MLSNSRIIRAALLLVYVVQLSKCQFGLSHRLQSYTPGYDFSLRRSSNPRYRAPFRAQQENDSGRDDVKRPPSESDEEEKSTPDEASSQQEPEPSEAAPTDEHDDFLPPSSEKPNPSSSESEASEPVDSEPEDSEPEDSKPEDSKPKDSKPEDSKPEDSDSPSTEAPDSGEEWTTKAPPAESNKDNNESSQSDAAQDSDKNGNSTDYSAVNILADLSKLWTNYVDLKLRFEAIAALLDADERNDVHEKILLAFANLSNLLNELSEALSTPDNEYKDSEHQSELADYNSDVDMWKHNYNVLNEFLEDWAKTTTVAPSASIPQASVHVEPQTATVPIDVSPLQPTAGSAAAYPSGPSETYVPPVTSVLPTVTRESPLGFNSHSNNGVQSHLHSQNTRVAQDPEPKPLINDLDTGNDSFLDVTDRDHTKTASGSQEKNHDDVDEDIYGLPPIVPNSGMLSATGLDPDNDAEKALLDMETRGEELPAVPLESSEHRTDVEHDLASEKTRVNQDNTSMTQWSDPMEISFSAPEYTNEPSSSDLASHIDRLVEDQSGDKHDEHGSTDSHGNHTFPTSRPLNSTASTSGFLKISGANTIIICLVSYILIQISA